MVLKNMGFVSRKIIKILYIFLKAIL